MGMLGDDLTRHEAALAVALLLAAGAASGLPVLGAEDPPEPSPEGFLLLSDDEGAYLGVRLIEETEHPEGGARITWILEDSPADRAGLREGDIIVGLDELPIRGPLALTRRIESRSPGETVELVIVRDRQERTVVAELGKEPEDFRGALPLGHLRALRLDDLELEGLRRERCVTQALLVEGRNLVRIQEPSGDAPPGFEPAAPTLEDAYLLMIRNGDLTASAAAAVPVGEANP